MNRSANDLRALRKVGHPDNTFRPTRCSSTWSGTGGENNRRIFTQPSTMKTIHVVDIVVQYYGKNAIFALISVREVRYGNAADHALYRSL